MVVLKYPSFPMSVVNYCIAWNGQPNVYEPSSFFLLSFPERVCNRSCDLESIVNQDNGSLLGHDKSHGEYELLSRVTVPGEIALRPMTVVRCLIRLALLLRYVRTTPLVQLSVSFTVTTIYL